MDTIRLDELVEQTPEAVAILTTDDCILGISKEFTRMVMVRRIPFCVSLPPSSPPAP